MVNNTSFECGVITLLLKEFNYNAFSVSIQFLVVACTWYKLYEQYKFDRLNHHYRNL